MLCIKAVEQLGGKGVLTMRNNNFSSKGLKRIVVPGRVIPKVWYKRPKSLTSKKEIKMTEQPKEVKHDAVPHEPVTEDIKHDAGPKEPIVEQEIDLGLDDFLPDLDMPAETAAPVIIADKHDAHVKFSFVGIGQGGCRLAEAFYKLGYRRVCAINTAQSDLDSIDLPVDNKLCLSTGGAAKNRLIGKDAVEKRSENILTFMKKCFGPEFDRIIVLATAGGGTGSGGFTPLIKLCEDLLADLRIDTGSESHIKLFLAIPPNSERDRMKNAMNALRDVEKLLAAGNLTPVVLIDNERIREIYPNATMGDAWGRSNLNIAGLFHTFNILAGAPTKYDVFDQEDYKSVLKSGLVTCGAMPVVGDLATAFRENAGKTVLMSGVELSTAKVAACLLIGSADSIDALDWAVVQDAYASLNRVVGGCTLHRGFYAAKRSLAAHTLIGGLKMPAKRLDEIARLAGRKDWDA